MGRMSSLKPQKEFKIENLLGAIYAAKKFTSEAESFLGMTGIGLYPKFLSRDMERAWEILEERLAEMREAK